MTVDLFVIVLVSALSLLVPGPAVLLVISTALAKGRRAALVTVLGVMAASTLWSAAAAFGMGALMLANAWALEVVRYAGGA
ncbi:MAG: LysE family transporter, partial [Myxococcota bacterium]